MRTIKCPHGDNGVCGIPDRAVLLFDGTASFVSRKALEGMGVIPESDEDTTTRIRSIDFTIPEEIVSEAHGIDSVLGKTLERFVGMGGGSFEDARGVIITCSCGHTWIMDLSLEIA